MKCVKLYDDCFSHHGPIGSVSSFPGVIVKPKTFEWDRNPSSKHDIAVFTDGRLEDAVTCDSMIKIAWLIEPRDFGNPDYNRLESSDVNSRFDMILTHDERLISLGGKFKKYIFGGSWTKESDYDVYRKTKDLCIIASHKHQLHGHQLRHQAINMFASKYNISVFGNGYKNFDQTLDVLKDYRYCVVIENIKNGVWITEKLITPFLAGCIPLYYGSSFANEIFDNLKSFDNLNELEKLLLSCNETYYNSEMKNIKNNFETAKNYSICEDWLFENIFKQLMV